jgi:hypothetical protein
MMTGEEAGAARQMLELVAHLSKSESILARRAGERVAAILADLLYEQDPASGFPNQHDQ